MEVIVGKKWDKGAVYIGRPSPLGNPFVMHGEHTRDQVCDQYQAWFDKKVAEEDPAVMSELRRLYKLAQQTGSLTIGCYCAPKRCHGDTIKRFLEQFLGE